MQQNLPRPSSVWAYFLDLDGTLIAHAGSPDAVTVPPRLIALLRALQEATAGSVAIVSGRAIATIDELLHPLVLCAAGQHGFERRDAEGRLHRSTMPPAILDTLTEAMADLAREVPGVLLEEKGSSLALHYRSAPPAEARLREAVTALAAQFSDVVRLQEGRFVFELAPLGADKGRAITAFMSESPFCGRLPFFAGDDITDEAGFAVVNEARGMTVRIYHGDETDARPTAARYAVQGTTAFMNWLAGIEKSPKQ